MKSAVTKPATTAIATIDSQLAADAANIMKQISQPGGNRLKMQANGEFIHPDGTNLGNQISFVVLAFNTRNQWYEKDFNPSAPSKDPPDCYAIGDTIDELAPTDRVKQRQSDKCQECWANQWGSGKIGNTKACRQFRCMAILMTDGDEKMYRFEASPAQLKAIDSGLKETVIALGGPIKAIMTLTGRPVTQTYGTFDVKIDPNPDYAKNYERVAEAKEMLAKDYFDKPEVAPAQQPRRNMANQQRQPGPPAKR